MPIFDQYCLDCKVEFEALVLTQAHEAMIVCPRCHSKHLERLPSVMHFQQATPRFELKRGPCHNPFEGLTLYHVRDENNKPIRVNSEKELRAAERKYKFVHAASHSMSQDSLNTPPQHELGAGDIRRDYEWKWTPPEQRNDMTGVSVGPTTKDHLLVEKGA
jgi:putative FmdB family regulatory protein